MFYRQVLKLCVFKELEYDIETKGKMSNYDTLDMLFEKIGQMLTDYDINVNKLG